MEVEGGGDREGGGQGGEGGQGAAAARPESRSTPHEGAGDDATRVEKDDSKRVEKQGHITLASLTSWLPMVPCERGERR